MSELPDPTPPAEIAPPHVVTVEELRHFVELLGLSRAASERSSALLLFEIYCRFRLNNRGVVFNLPGDPAKIIAEVRGLEGLGCLVGTKPAEPFVRPPLQGLWKKHYLVGGVGSMAENIRLGLGRKQRGLRKIIEENYNPTTSHLPLETVSRKIANAIVNTYAERSRKQRLTGQYIVYAQHEGQNYYLCLATHGEDADVFERIKRGCVEEFPFLCSQLKL